MRVAVLADIGQPVYHVGDEAIGHAAAERLVARGADVVLLTRDVAHTRRHHGDVAAAPTFQFPWPPVDAERYLGEIRDVLGGNAEALPPHDQVHAIRATLAGVDALLIAGGGNLNSSYRWLLYERVATALVAHHLGKPVVLTGQTLGPALVEHDRGLVAELLGLCAFVSLREQRSVRLARELAPAHPALVGGLDDAAFWPDGPDAAPSPQRVVATFAPGTGPIPRGDAVPALAGLLDALAATAGVEVDLVPHMATPGVRDVDVAFHDEIVAASASGRLRSLPIEDAPAAARQVGGAALVVTSRYHPVVFAGSRAVPVFALVPDHYADVRIGGALANAGLPGWGVPLSAVLTPLASEALSAVWRARADVAAHLERAHAALRASHERRWDDLVAALAGRPVDAAALAFPPVLPAPAEVAAARAAFGHVLDLTGAAEQERLEAERARARLALLEAATPHEPSPSPGLLGRVQRGLGRVRRGTSRD